jgi:hypothetical protein
VELYQINADPEKIYTRQQLKEYSLNRWARDLEPGETLTVSCFEPDPEVLKRTFRRTDLHIFEDGTEQVAPADEAQEMTLRKLLRDGGVLYSEVFALAPGSTRDLFRYTAVAYRGSASGEKPFKVVTRFERIS